jgi:uncharacterized protein YaaW (UPF0174 family)
MAADDLHDPDLTPLLRECSSEDLQPLVEYVTRTRTQTYGAATKERVYDDPHNRVVDDVVHEVATFGGNSLANRVRGRGVRYAEVVADVAAQLKVKTAKDATVEERELAILLKILDDSINKMSVDEREALEEEFRRAGVKNADFRAGAPVAAVLAQAGVQLTGFFAYRMAVIVANAVAKAVLGRGLSLGANAALTRLLGIFAGPIGWAISGIWTAVDLAGPAYRVTIPCVCHIALLRQKRQYGELADA